MISGEDTSTLDIQLRLNVTCLVETFAVAVKTDLLMPLVTYTVNKDSFEVVKGDSQEGRSPS